MKKATLFLSMLILGVTSYAQQFDSDNAEKIDAVKEYRQQLFKEKLDLNDKQLEGFLKVYNMQQIELRSAKRTFRKKWYTFDIDKLNENQAKEYFEDAIALQKKEHDLILEFAPKLAQEIGWSKVVRVKKVEREIKPLLLEKANELKIEKKRRSASKKAKSATGKNRKP